MPSPFPFSRMAAYRLRTVLIATALLLPSLVHAQTIGRIAGRVTDDNDRPLQGARVAVIGVSPAREMTINKADGSYAIPGMRPGEYEVEFSAFGYESQRKTVRVVADRTSLLNARLNFDDPEHDRGSSVALAPERPAGTTEKPVSIPPKPVASPPVVAPSKPAPVLSAQVPVTEEGKAPGGNVANIGHQPAETLAPVGPVPTAVPVERPTAEMSSGDAAGPSGGILVQVIDDNGKPLGGARLFIGDAKRSIAALPDGSIGVEKLPPGEYDVTLTMKGYQSEKRNVRVAANRVITLIVKLPAAEDAARRE